MNQDTIPDIMYEAIESEYYTAELEVLDRYLNFATELLRLSLLAMGVVGFLSSQSTFFASITKEPWVRNFVVFGVIFLALSAALAIGYRCFVTDAYHCYTRGLRVQRRLQVKKAAKENQIEKNCSDKSGSDYNEAICSELIMRKRRLTITLWCKASSAFFLAFGSLSIGIAFVIILFRP